MIQAHPCKFEATREGVSTFPTGLKFQRSWKNKNYMAKGMVKNQFDSLTPNH
jgi:hypothetical protein